jgi:hypothetical protein
MANAPRPRTGANTTDHLPSLRAQRSNPSSLRMRHGLLRCARNDDQSSSAVAKSTGRRPAQAKRDAGPITTGRRLRGSHRTASLNTRDTAYASPRPRGRHRYGCKKIDASDRMQTNPSLPSMPKQDTNPSFRGDAQHGAGNPQPIHGYRFRARAPQRPQSANSNWRWVPCLCITPPPLLSISSGFC